MTFLTEEQAWVLFGAFEVEYFWRGRWRRRFKHRAETLAYLSYHRAEEI